ncbi:hypothetical protein [Dokdonella sp.]|uniref:hypothetical protein n=1 Tax=Dokdonella sp. TaxID=2291710 RepID=UPI00262A90FC|nr:hypothetical protein [Dokdonella sp.]
MSVEGVPSRRFIRNRAVLLTVLAALVGSVTASDKVARTEQVETRFGPVSFGLTGENWPGTAFIRFKGKPLLDESTSGWGVYMVGRYALPEGEVLFFQIQQGTACPWPLWLLKIDKRGKATLSDSFGACGEATIRRTGDELIIETPGACHAIDEQDELDACNESLRRDYSYRNGRLEEILRGK